ncbi:hypothetical protein C8R48DRAFT_614336 [Suillus tomentosus]|nr:hypothetical protein C8R48DRAFT_614336 [Suillus tomentosus]
MFDVFTLSTGHPFDSDEHGATQSFHFFINLTSFGESVENLYYLSFLFRDGLCGVHMQVNGELILCRCYALSSDYTLPPTGLTELTTENIGGSPNEKNQTIWEFDMATWQCAIEVFDITKSVIPPRVSLRTSPLTRSAMASRSQQT